MVSAHTPPVLVDTLKISLGADKPADTVTHVSPLSLDRLTIPASPTATHKRGLSTSYATSLSEIPPPNTIASQVMPSFDLATTSEPTAMK